MSVTDALSIPTSGDIVIKDLICSNDTRIRDIDDTNLTSTRSFFVYDDPDVQEVSRVVHGLSSDKESGSIAIQTLETIGGDQNMPTNISSAAQCTKILTGDTSNTISNIGLSFDSDDSAIFFGGNKEFKIVLETGTPSRLLFQSYNSTSLSYVTRFSCLSG